MKDPGKESKQDPRGHHVVEVANHVVGVVQVEVRQIEGERQAGEAIVRITPEEVWWPVLDPIRSHPSIQTYLESIGLSGRTVHRTPVEERVRPAILRTSDAAAAAEAAEESAP